MRGSYRALPFRLTPNAETMIIGTGGGGPDVVACSGFGQSQSDGSRNEPADAEVCAAVIGARAGNLYDRPDVETVLSEGRNFISRTDRRFDIILLGFVDSWASGRIGWSIAIRRIICIRPEAMRAYYDHLERQRESSVVLRWEMDIPRLVSNAGREPWEPPKRRKELSC
jgi:hypothetical protein